MNIHLVVLMGFMVTINIMIVILSMVSTLREQGCSVDDIQYTQTVPKYNDPDMPLLVSLLDKHRPFIVHYSHNVFSKLTEGQSISNIASIMKNETMRLMVTSSGIVGYYSQDVLINPRITGELVSFTTSDKFDTVLLNHIQLDDFADPFLYFKGEKIPLFFPNEKYYLRTIGDTTLTYKRPIVNKACPKPFPYKFVSGQFFMSQKGVVTNLHFDSTDGIISQVQGKKKIICFSPDYTKHLYFPQSGPLERRSQMDGRLTYKNTQKYPKIRYAEGLVVTLCPDEWIYIPSKWIHYVETLSEETISCVYRFNF
jgi:hypothetical protein